MKGYLGSGLIKGIGEKTAAEIVARFGVNALDILEKQPEQLLEVRGITENRLEDIKTSFAESRALRDIMTLLAPFKLTPATAQRIYQQLGPASVKVLKENPYELCRISGFGFLRVDAIVQHTDRCLNTPMRIKGALYYALDKAQAEKGHLFLPRDTLVCEALKLLNKRIPVPELRVQKAEVEDIKFGVTGKDILHPVPCHMEGKADVPHLVIIRGEGELVCQPVRYGFLQHGGIAAAGVQGI